MAQVFPCEINEIAEYSLRPSFSVFVFQDWL